MKVANNRELSPEFVNSMVNRDINDGRPRLVTLWVGHFMNCGTCRQPKTEFPAQAKQRSQLCNQGRRLLDNWLDED